MPKPKRPSLVLSFQVDAELREALELRARAENRSVSSLVRMILEGQLYERARKPHATPPAETPTRIP